MRAARTRSGPGVRFLRLVLDLITFLFQEASDGLAIIDAFVWHARFATRRIPPDPSRFAHLSPFARHVVLDLIAQLVRWRRQLLAPSRSILSGGT